MKDISKKIKDLLISEYETSKIYPFAIAYDRVTEKKISEINELCDGYDDSETIYGACLEALGVNPVLK